MESDYAGTLSTLTKYGTMNVSVARIPRKKRSRGNITPPRDRCIALTDCVSIMPDGTRTVFSPLVKNRTRKPNRVVVVAPSKSEVYENRVRRFGATGDSNH